MSFLKPHGIQFGIWQLQRPGSGGLPAEEHPAVHVNAGLVRNSRPVPAANALTPAKQTVHIRYGQRVSTHARKNMTARFQPRAQIQTPQQ